MTLDEEWFLNDTNHTGTKGLAPKLHFCASHHKKHKLDWWSSSSTRTPA
jgi:hypothetical protein